MKNAQALPQTLADRYYSWKSTTLVEKQEKYHRLAVEGQKPPALVISCCDSRVNSTALFGTDAGEFFIHRNIANLVPAYDTTSENHGTAAAIEYAVTALGVQHIMVVGHSSCGGIAGCHAKCSGNAPALEAEDSFVGKWVEGIRPAFDRVMAKGLPQEDELTALEQESVICSLENLMDFPYVAEGVAAGSLSLHGLWFDIANGDLKQYLPDAGTFEDV